MAEHKAAQAELEAQNAQLAAAAAAPPASPSSALMAERQAALSRFAELKDKAAAAVPVENALAPLAMTFSDKAEDMGTSNDMPLFDCTFTAGRIKQVRV